MELFALDISTNRPSMYLEKYESFLWVDRFNDLGEFKMTLEPNSQALTWLGPDALIGCDQSDRIMRIVTQSRENKDGKKSLSLTGRSFDMAFADRAARKTLSSATWNITDTAGNIIRTMVNDICVAGTGISSSDVIPTLSVTNLSSQSAVFTANIKAGTLLERIQEIAKANGLGLRLVYTREVQGLRFEIYDGVDRSSYGGVTFSEELDNLSDTSFVVTRDGYKNVAYVVAPNGTRIVTTTNGTGSSGISRRVLYIDASDITLAAGASLQNALEHRGQSELAKLRSAAMFDGTVNPSVGFLYGKDYNLGDIVRLRGDLGISEQRRVTEHIWSFDEANGHQSFPTMATLGEA